MASTYRQGGDAQAVSRIAQNVYGGYHQMFEEHGWVAPGSELMTRAPGLIVRDYGSIRDFELAHDSLQDFWDRNYSVLFTTFYGWAPETWACVGWTDGANGKTRRDNLLKQLTDPFVVLAGVTKSSRNRDRNLAGKVAGFYLMSHQMGHRDHFTHPLEHGRMPDHWQHALRALRAFSFRPEDRPDIHILYPDYTRRGMAVHVGSSGVLIAEAWQLDMLRSIPWYEVDMYSAHVLGARPAPRLNLVGMVRGGPASREQTIVVRGGSEWLERELYILRLEGDADAMLGRPAGGRAIVKLGLAASPDVRRQEFQKALPNGAYKWRIDRSLSAQGLPVCRTHTIALRGEVAMKKVLGRDPQLWLGGEFYLATEEEIEAAWAAGLRSIGS